MPDNSSPRVLILRSSCGLYGAEGVIANLVRFYPADTLTVCLEDLRDRHVELCDLLAAEGYSTHTVPARSAFDPAMIPRFLSIVRSFRPNLLHSHDYKSDALIYLVGKLLRLPCVSTVHGNLRHTRALRRYEKWDAWMLCRFRGIAVVSEERADEVRRYGVPAERLTVITNGIDTKRFQPIRNRAACRSALQIPPDGPLVGIVGRLSEEKGHTVLLEALQDLPHVRVVVVGEGELDHPLRTAAVNLGVSDRVHFLGRRENMPEVYGALDVLALPSFSEGLPLTVIEAAACGVPIVATPVGDIPRVVINGQTGLLVEPGNPRALRDALSHVLDGPTAEMGKAARALAVKEFGVQAMADAYDAFYRRALGWPPPRDIVEAAP